MLISIRCRLSLLALPRTGTTAVEAALAPYGDIHFSGVGVKHLRYAQYRRRVLPMLQEGLGAHGLETVCVVREPVDWLRSWWAYRARRGLRGRPASTHGVPFAAFVEAWLEADPPRFASVGRPSRFVRAPKGAPGVDHLFRYEAMDRYAAFLSERFGRRVRLPRLNASPRVGAAELPASLRARLEAERAEDFEVHARIA